MISKTKLRDIIIYSIAGLATATYMFFNQLDNTDKSLRSAPIFEYKEMDLNSDGYIDRVTLTNTKVISRLYNPNTQEFVFSETYSIFDNKLNR